MMNAGGWMSGGMGGGDVDLDGDRGSGGGLLVVAINTMSKKKSSVHNQSMN